MDPFTRKPFYLDLPVCAYSFKEAFSEKIRALLCRREPAIRDFFDIFYAVKNSLIDLNDDELISLTLRKIEVPGNEFLGVTEERAKLLKLQLETELRARSKITSHFGAQIGVRFGRAD